MASITVVDANGALSFTAAAGGETVNGSGMSGALTVFGGSDSEAIIGGSGADTLIGGTGSDTLTGGALLMCWESAGMMHLLRPR